MSRDQNGTGIFTQFVPSSRDLTSQNTQQSTAEPGLGPRLTHLPSPPGLVRAGQGPAMVLQGPTWWLWAPQCGWCLWKGWGGGRRGTDGDPTEPFHARCCHDHLHFTEEKIEALRSQNPALADPKDCSTPSSRKPSHDPIHPNSMGLRTLSARLPRPSSPPRCELPSS